MQPPNSNAENPGIVSVTSTEADSVTNLLRSESASSRDMVMYVLLARRVGVYEAKRVAGRLGWKIDSIT